MAKARGSGPESLRATWEARWPDALGVWSRFTRLTPPRFCLTEEEEGREKLDGSFAMIRLADHAVVVSLRQAQARGLSDFALEILAHEVGHHVYAPADLSDNARLIARTRAGLPTREAFAPLVANLYTDLLINDRLQRAEGLRIAEVYRALGPGDPDPLWTLYMRIYEVLWSLPPGTLGPAKTNARTRTDADLGARVVRAYAKDWLGGAGRFAALCLPYLLKEDPAALAARFGIWADAAQAGAGAQVPDGLTEMEDEELGGVLHPAEDPSLTGLTLQEEDGPEPGADGGRETVGGKKHNYRAPTSYVELMRSLGVDLPEDELLRRYYRERARPHLVPFPAKEVREASDPLPEGLDVWDPGSPITEVDWVESLARNPTVIPGVTTLRRLYGTSEGGSPERLPLDLYIGIDCSGSMANPRVLLSYPVLAGTVIALSALRTGARVMACLSGEPGEHSDTGGFVRSEREILTVLTGYLGTGYAFGVLRLQEAFLGEIRPVRPTHILVVTDSDFFYMLSQVKGGWEMAAEAAAVAGGGATCVLNIPPRSHPAEVGRLRKCGWEPHFVSSWEEMVTFARAFSRLKYGEESRLDRAPAKRRAKAKAPEAP